MIALRRIHGAAISDVHCLASCYTESLIVATYFAAHVHQLRGESTAAQERAELVVALAEEYGLAVWIALGLMHRGWALTEQGAVGDGLQELRRGLAAYEATGARLWRAHFLGLLAQALAKADRMQEGLTAAAEALAVVRETGEQGSAAELNRVYGELLLATGSSGSVSEAMDYFTRALAIAREQRAKSWELRVATSMWTLSRHRSERGNARRLVKETYGWFTEGHETADLRAAREVLTPS